MKRKRNNEREREYASKWRSLNPGRRQSHVDKWLARSADKRTTKRHAVRAAIAAAKSAPCLDCGNTFDPVCMDFDHRPGEAKKFGIARFGDRPLGVVLQEIAKCDLVCSNCHRLRTHRRRNHQEIGTPRNPEVVSRQTALDLAVEVEP